MEPQVIRTSDRSLFKACRQRWEWGSRTRRNLEPVQGSTALDFGTAIHAGLEAYYQPKTWGYHTQMQANALQGFLDSIRSTRCDAEDYEELKALGLGMLDNYFAWAPANDTWKPVMVEQEFEIP